MKFKMTFNVKKAKEWKKASKSPYRIIARESTESGSIEVWQLPKSKYSIQYLANEKGDNRWRVMEVYITDDGQIRTRGDLPYKDYDSYLKALNHIQKDYEIEKDMMKPAKKSYYFSLKPEKREKAYHFLNANYTIDELNNMSDEESEKILKANKKEWDY